MEETVARRKRINRLKKIILGTVVMAILIPTAICIFLGWKVSTLSGQISRLEGLLEEAKNRESEQEVGVFATAHVEESPRETYSEEVLQENGRTQELSEEYTKRIYLTFDDGPSSNTNAILDILKEYDVKATFFVIGKTDEASKAVYQRIVAEGHTLGMHSYNHKYDEVYASKEGFIEDLTLLQEYLYEVTGIWPRYYRFPGGSSNTVSKVDMQQLISYLNEKNITYFDWNVASGDAISSYQSKETIVENCLMKLQEQSENMILLHDAAEKRSTVEALPEIISKIRLRGDACFLPITDETPKIQHLKQNETINNSNTKR